MKVIKKIRGYGSFEYMVIISMLILLSLIILLNVKGSAFNLNRNIKDSSDAFSYQFKEVAETIKDFPVIEMPRINGIKVIFPDPNNKPFFYFKENQEVSSNEIISYMNENDIKVKERNTDLLITSFEIKNIRLIDSEESYLQFEVSTNKGNEVVRAPAMQTLPEGCFLAKDEDFEIKIEPIWDKDQKKHINTPYFYYIGPHLCVKVPNKINGENITSYRHMFRETLVHTVISTNENIVDMSNIFQRNSSNIIDLSSFVTKNVENMQYMFAGVHATEIILGEDFDSSNVTNMDCMFQEINNQLNFDFSKLNTSKVETMESMFYLNRMNILDLSSFDTSSLKNVGFMFERNRATVIDLSSFNFSNIVDVHDDFLYSSNADIIYVKTVLDQTILNTVANKAPKTQIIIK